MRQEPYQILVGRLFEIRHPGDDIIEVFAWIDIMRLACREQRADDGHVLRGLVVSAEEVVLSSESYRADGVFRQIIQTS